MNQGGLRPSSGPRRQKELDGSLTLCPLWVISGHLVNEPEGHSFPAYVASFGMANLSVFWRYGTAYRLPDP